MRAARGPGVVIWLTGLPGAGKSTLAEAAAHALHGRGRSVEVLDGDAVRKHISSDLSFSREDRDAQVGRLAFIAHLLARNGVDVIVAAVSPFREARAAARAVIGTFVEVHVATPLTECARRDPKGLYAKARAGVISDFTGVQDPYEEPLDPELRIDASAVPVDECVARILASLEALGYVH